ncbi:ankyrin repeat-containing domain protein [Dactylonectria estremocensis]|uniref:Ankyrin repeat-containing domain protein n=1 Tax=Dactylonectria estremocensis TaxID=1079267 RepID=A0A9P9EU07_9HYPO|nr:ankyrin repeat-containing domain protein [Dactylonectria estremocensis]
MDSFVVAAAMGHEAVSCLLLKHGADINGGGQRSRTPLTAAAIRGNEVVVRFLVANSADINPQNGKLMPPMAALAGSTEAVVRFLVRNGADVNYQDGTSYTPLTATVLVNDEEMVRLLIDNGADVNADCAAVLQVAKKQGYRMPYLSPGILLFLPPLLLAPGIQNFNNQRKTTGTRKPGTQNIQRPRPSD